MVELIVQVRQDKAVQSLTITNRKVQTEKKKQTKRGYVA